jgi:tetratricopeptide (TPR) repeat protein
MFLMLWSRAPRPFALLRTRFSGAVLVVLAPLVAADTPEQLYQQALQNFSEQRFAATESLLRDVIRQRPRWFEPRFLLGATLVSLRRPAEGVVELEQAHRVNPAHLDCVKLLAAEYLGLNRPADTIRVLQPRLIKTPDEETLLLGIEALHVLDDPGDADEAFRLGTLGVKRFPRSARMLAWHGYALRERGSLPLAQRTLEAVLSLNPEDLASKGLLGDVLRRQGLFDQALRLFDEALRQAPGDEEALIGRARTLAAMGRTQEALEAMQNAVGAAPGVARLRLEISQLHAKLGDRESAAREAAEFRRLRGSEASRTIPAGLRAASGADR